MATNLSFFVHLLCHNISFSFLTTLSSSCSKYGIELLLSLENLEEPQIRTDVLGTQCIVVTSPVIFLYGPIALGARLLNSLGKRHLPGDMYQLTTKDSISSELSLVCYFHLLWSKLCPLKIHTSQP